MNSEQRLILTAAPRSKLHFFFLLLCLLLPTCGLKAAEGLNWRTNQNLVSADIKSQPLVDVLAQIASVTHWQVYLEPNTTRNISAKFDNLRPGEALNLMMGDLNFALVPQTNASPKLFVFRTSRQNATQLVPAKTAAAKAKIIPNELIVRLKPGAKIDDIARLLGAKVVGRIDGLNAYRLRFDDEAATAAAREQLSQNSDVASVDYNYSIDRPTDPRAVQAGGVPPVQLQLKPPPETGQVIIGLVDTATQPMCDNLNSFMLKPVSVAGPANLDPQTPSHGTTMAATMLRSLQAVTKGTTSVQILPVDVYGPNPTTSTFDVANGIVAAANGGAKIINLSLGSTGDSPFLHNVIQDVSKQNIDIFAAAGNEPVTTPFYPAAYPEVMAVTAVDQGQLASYANRGDFVSLGAPGDSVVCFDGQQYMVEGTSASSAFTSGIAAGYMDSTHSSTDKAKAFVSSQFGVKITPAGGK